MSQFKIGDRVKRGPTWCWAKQDHNSKGEETEGEIIHIYPDDWVQVQWDHEGNNSFSYPSTRNDVVFVSYTFKEGDKVRVLPFEKQWGPNKELLHFNTHFLTESEIGKVFTVKSISPVTGNLMILEKSDCACFDPGRFEPVKLEEELELQYSVVATDCINLTLEQAIQKAKMQTDEENFPHYVVKTSKVLGKAERKIVTEYTLFK